MKNSFSFIMCLYTQVLYTYKYKSVHTHVPKIKNERERENLKGEWW